MFKKSKKVENFSTDIDIYSEDGSQYDKDKIKNINECKVDFAYDNGISYMQEIDKGMKIISARATLLLGYLSTLIAVIAAALFQSLPVNEPTEVFYTIMLFSYVIIIFFIVSLLLTPSSAASIYNEPKNILNKEMFQHDMVMIKIFETELVQDRITQNLNKQQRRAKYLQFFIWTTFIAPIFAAIFSFVVPLHSHLTLM